MKKMKGKIVGAVIVASSLLVLSGCRGKKNTATTTTETTTETEPEVIRYTVSFVTNVDELLDSIEAEEGEAITLPTPSYEGMTFKGWYLDEELTKACTLTKMPAKDITLYAKWEANTYKIAFDMQGGEAISPIKLYYGQEIPEIEVPERPGYTFLGWEEEVPESMPAGNLILTAKWEKNTYTVTFILGNGEDDIVTTYFYDDEIAYPTPSRLGYTFKGWSGDYQSDTMPASNLTFTAEWEVITYTITYMTDGGVVGDAAATYTVNDAITLPVPVWTGYTFLGWYLDESHTQEITSIPAGTTGDLVLYADYYHDSYTITFDMNGAEAVSLMTYHYGDVIEYPEVTRKGYTFTGYTPSYEIMPAESFTAVANWSLNTYCINYNAAGGTVTDGTVWFTVNDTVELPVPVYLGHTFKGWYLDEAYTKPVSEITDTAEDVTLYALWDMDSYSISYACGMIDNIPFVYDTTSELPEAYNVTSEFTFPQAYVSDGRYTFCGWYLDEAYEHEITSIVPQTTGDITLYPKFEYTVYEITYDAGVGTMPDSYAASYTYKDEITLPVLSKDGYDFLGWYDAEDNKVEVIAAGSTGDYDFTAKWSIITYTVTYVFYGTENDTSIMDSSYLPEGTVTSFTVLDSFDVKTPVKAGYTFTKMCSDLDMTEEITSVPAGTCRNITVYVTSAYTEYNISYTLNGGKLPSDSVTSYTILTKSINTPTQNGYTFMGWYQDPDFTEEFEYEQGVTGDLSLYAKWEVITYTIQMVAGYEYATYSAFPTSWKVTDGDVFAAPVYPGYAFQGYTWKDKDGNVCSITNLPIEATTITLYDYFEACYLLSDNGDGTKTITGLTNYFIDLGANVTVPTYIDGAQITRIGDIPEYDATYDQYVFAWYGNHMTSIVIPEGITYIGRASFMNLDNLKSITLPDSLESLGEQAFMGTGLTSITFGANVTTMPYNLCFLCKNLKTVTFKGSTLTIEGDAFESCAITEINWGGSYDGWFKGSHASGWDYGSTYYVNIGTSRYSSKGYAYTHVMMYQEYVSDSNLLYDGFVAPGETVACTSMWSCVYGCTYYDASDSSTTYTSITAASKVTGDSPKITIRIIQNPVC